MNISNKIKNLRVLYSIYFEITKYLSKYFLIPILLLFERRSLIIRIKLITKTIINLTKRHTRFFISNN